ncbi:hypothetical protein [Rhodospirillum sp. A1_3_36]|uniref:hypothetical protein n=1 Tax=Rhodospirillum sp. A1_3_36 TaxID=3391666 RepID=UPI0039A71D3E
MLTPGEVMQLPPEDELVLLSGLVRRDLDVLTESLAFFVKLYLTFNAHAPVPDRAAQAVARDRFQQFIEQVGRQIAGGKRSLDQSQGEGR